MPHPALHRLTAVVFDLDGTLVDSETVSHAAMTVALAADGITVTHQHHADIVGGAWPATRQYLVDTFGFDDAAIDRYRQRASLAWDQRLASVEVFPDAAATLEALDGVTLGVCTASSRRYLDRMLTLPALAGRFAASVARDDTDRSKPAPDPYLLTARRLGVAPSSCVAVEDTPTGIAAATAAGMTVIAVNRDLGLDLSGAVRVVDTLTVDAILAVAP